MDIKKIDVEGYDVFCAAQQLDGDGKYAEAAGAASQLGELHWTAELLEKAGRYDEAAGIALKLGSYKKSAELFERAGKREEGAERLLNAGGVCWAVDLLESAGNYGKAAEIAWDTGRMFWALYLFCKHGKRAEGLEFLAMKKVGKDIADKTLEVFELSRKAIILESQGRHDDMEETALKAGRICVEVISHLKSRKYAKGAERLLKLNLPDEAVMLFSGAGKHKEGAELLRKSGCVSEAAELLHMEAEHEEGDAYR